MSEPMFLNSVRAVFERAREHIPRAELPQLVMNDPGRLLPSLSSNRSAFAARFCARPNRPLFFAERADPLDALVGDALVRPGTLAGFEKPSELDGSAEDDVDRGPASRGGLREI